MSTVDATVVSTAVFLCGECGNYFSTIDDIREHRCWGNVAKQCEPVSETVQETIEENVAIPKKRREVGKKSSVWNHFSALGDGQEKGICHYCSANVSYKGGSTNNFLRHLKSRHPTVLEGAKRPYGIPVENVFKKKEVIKKKYVVKKRSQVWNHFSLIERKGKCDYCPSVLSYAGGSTNNLLNHLKRKHSEVLEAYYHKPKNWGVSETGQKQNEGGTVAESRQSEAGTTVGHQTSKKNSVFNHFSMTDSNGQCVYCDSVVSFDGGSTRNLIYHLRQKHPDALDLLKQPVNWAGVIGTGWDRRSGKKRSHIWNHFSQTNRQGRCRYCGKVLSFRGGSTNNLMRHLKSKHPGALENQPETWGDSGVLETSERQIWGGAVGEQDEERQNGDGSMAGQDNEQENEGLPVLGLDDEPQNPDVTTAEQDEEQENQDVTTCTGGQDKEWQSVNGNAYQKQKELWKPSMVRAGSKSRSYLSRYYRRPTSDSRSKVIDDQIVRMVVKGCQLFTIVDSPEFRKMAQMLNPDYKLPTHQILSKVLIPQMYERTKHDVKKHLETASAVSITTDGWTSINDQSYIAVTVHFIDEKCVLMHYLLDCFECEEGDTAERLAEKIRKVLTEWNIENKVVAVVSDGSVKAAARAGNWSHVGCFAHAVNSVVQNAIMVVHEVHLKVKTIVEYFKRSPRATSELKSLQREMDCPEVKLKQDDAARWNSTYEMFLRVLKTKEPILSAMELEETALPQLDLNDWSIIKKTCDVLKIFYEATGEMSGEESVTVSKVILLSNAMRACTSKEAENTCLPEEICKMVEQLLDEMSRRFAKAEEQPFLLETTLLDPRFKKHAFKQENLFKSTYKSLAEMANLQTPDENSSPGHRTAKEKPKSLIWEEFDSKVTNQASNESASSAGTIELDKYLQEPYVDRTADPLKWWASRKFIYPRLFNIVKRKFCVVATSVPCERIFSKSGHAFSERRRRLTPSKVSQILFLSENL